MVCLQAEKDEPVTVHDFVERSEEFFGKKLKRFGIRKRILKTGEFEIKEGNIFPVESDED